MSISHNGLTKVIEECGELIQISAKKIAFENIDEHPDKKGSMKIRIENEMGDVLAAIIIAIKQHNLNDSVIIARAEEKKKLFQNWIDDPKI